MMGLAQVAVFGSPSTMSNYTGKNMTKDVDSLKLSAFLKPSEETHYKRGFLHSDERPTDGSVVNS